MKKTTDMLNIFSLILCIVIILVILFGSRKKKYIEKFETTTVPLTDFQKQILEGVKSGNIDTNTIEQYVKENKFSKDDLNAIIRYIVDNMDKPQQTASK